MWDSVIWPFIAKWGAGIATGGLGLLITYLVLPLVNKWGKALYDKVVAWFKLRQRVSEIKKEAKAKEDALDKVLKDENATKEEIKDAQEDRLNGW